MKKIILMILTGICLTVFQSCSDWLDVQPKTELGSDVMFETEQGVKDALYGCYMLLSDSKLYGAEMTCTFMDVLGQQYSLPHATQNYYYNAASYVYTDASCEGIIYGIWSGLYNAIANVNALLGGLENGKERFDPMFYSLVKAEGYALRAFIYTDLVRIFTWGDLPHRSEKLQEFSIPYAKVYDKDIIPQSKLEDVLKYIHEDLETALALFDQYDPMSVTGNRPEDYVEYENDDPFYGKSARQFRMNIKAALAVRMRLNLWEGNYTAAYADAKILIEKYQLSFTAGLDRDKNMRDLTFSSEMLFGLETFNRYEQIVEKYFQVITGVTSSENNNALCLTSALYQDIFETSSCGATDVRPNYQWTLETQTGDYKFIKFDEYDDMKCKNLVPLIRPSEIYYAAAECALLEGDKNSAIGYVNTVRNGRGIPKDKDLSFNLSAEEAEEELFKERRKEFIGDGQMFYYYKRKGYSNIPNALGTITIDDKVYVLPLPQDEVDFGGRVELK